jgi:hypothetical protein
MFHHKFQTFRNIICLIDGHLFLKMIMSMAVNIFKLLLQLKYEVQFFQY